VLTNAIDPVGERLLAGVAHLVCAPDTQPETLNALVADADILIVRAFLPPDIFDRPQRLRGVVRHGVGLDMIPMQSATGHDIPVANVPGSNAEAVAEHAIAGLLLLARQQHRMDRALRQTDWGSARQSAKVSTELRGRTLGIVGMGSVGSRIAEIAHAGFQMKVLGTPSRRRTMPSFVESAMPASIFALSDFVVLACPLTTETHHLVNGALLATMKPTAALINVARGQVVDEHALAEVLAANRIRGAALDVFEEQPLPRDHPFLALDNVILSPHVAGLTEESMQRMSQGAAEEAKRLLAFERPLNLCNPEIWERHLHRHQQDLKGKR
jgi:D-3-phosphoglycerate dehydrogenase